MNIVVVTPPPFEPVTLDEVYAHLRLDPMGDPPTHPDDDMLRRQITTAREQVEQITRRSIIQQTLSTSLFEFPGWRNSCGLELKRPPYIGGAAVSYYDSNNVLQVLDPSGFYVDDATDLVPRLVFTGAGARPNVFCRQDAVRVTWKAGYAPSVAEPTTQAQYAANVPASIKDAVLVGVQLLYDELAVDKRTKLELMREALLSSYHVHSFS